LSHNRFQNIGASLIKDVADRTNTHAGDGTTAATVLARAIFREGCKAVTAGMNPMHVKRGMEAAVDGLVAALVENSRSAEGDDLRHVAMIACNSDESLASVVYEAVSKAGRHGVVTVNEGNTFEHSVETVDGVQLDQGFITPVFANAGKTQEAILDDPWILLTGDRISSLQQVLPVLELVQRRKRPLLIIAEAFEGEALKALIMNKTQGGLQIVLVKAPAYGQRKADMLVDIGILTGAFVLRSDQGDHLQDFRESHLGTAKKVTVSRTETLIQKGAGDKEAVATRIDMVKGYYNESAAGEFEKEQLRERMAKLTGHVAIINLGGSSEVEVEEIKDRMQDALHASMAAMEEGIVAGGGAALLYASVVAAGRRESCLNFEERAGFDAVLKAVREPCGIIARNSGEAGDEVVQTLQEHFEETRDWSHGFDAATSTYTDVFKAGIVDPTKVVKTSLINAASVATLMYTAESIVCNDGVVEKGPRKLSPYEQAGLRQDNAHGSFGAWGE